MTATQLIYEAWCKTPKPILYETNDGKGNVITVNCEFAHPETHKNYNEKLEGECLICGGKINGGVLAKKMLSSNYTDWHLHKNPQSENICKYCVMTMMLNMEANRMGLLRYSFCAGETLEILNRQKLRDRLLNPPKPPFVMVCAVSQKKHLAIKSKISYSRENYICMLEEEPIQVNLQQATDMINVCEALRGIGFTKDEIANGIVRYDKIKQFRMDAFDKINRLLKPIRNTRLFALCLYVSQKMNEEDAICYLGLKQRTATRHQELC